MSGGAEIVVSDYTKELIMLLYPNQCIGFLQPVAGSLEYHLLLRFRRKV